jgi:hypothetical protein
MAILRRIRGTVSVALIWAIAWLPVGVLVGLSMGWLGFRFLLVWTTLGACAGAVFAILLATFERKRTVHDLSSRRLTIWGAVGGAAIPVIASVLIDLLIRGISLTRGAPVVFGVLALMGAVCAWGTLRIARRGT